MNAERNDNSTSAGLQIFAPFQTMIEFSLLPAISIAFVVTVAFMFALRPFALSVGLVDKPGGRKAHIGEVPVIGGLAMFQGIYAGLLLVFGPSASLASLFSASFLLIAIGLADDRYGLTPLVRIVSQIAVVLIMVYGAGYELAELGDPLGFGPINMGPFTLIFTTVVTLTMINAFNLVDGVDGLAGCLTSITLLSFAVIAGYQTPEAAMSLTVVGAVLGFLVFNFPVVWNRPLRSFMGDAGSTMLGFSIVWIALAMSQGSERLVSPVICLWFAALPIFDCLTCFTRRTLKGKSPLAPGRDHFHHHLKRGGLGVRQVLAVLSGLQLSYAVTGLVAHFAGVPDVIMFVGWAILGLTQRKVIKTIAKSHRAWNRKRRRIRTAT